MVNRSVTWADWDDELLSLELQELAAADFDLSLTGFDPRDAGETNGNAKPKHFKGEMFQIELAL